MKRSFPAVATIVACAALAGFPHVSPEARGQDAQHLFELAQAAVGGARVRALHLRGEVLTANGWYGKRPGDPFGKSALDLKVLLPDHYLRTQATIRPDGQMPPFSRGFAGSTPIGAVNVANVSRVDSARLMLILVLNTNTAFPLKLRSVLGPSGELQFDGPHNLYFALTLDPETKLPTSVRTPVRAPLPDGLPGPEVLREVVTSVESRRTVEGVNVPVHLVVKNLADSSVLEEFRFAEVRINPPLARGDFKR